MEAAGIGLLILVFVGSLFAFKFINKEDREDKMARMNAGTIFVYQDPQTGQFELYLEPNVTPKEMATRDDVCFKVEYIARK